MTRLIAIVLIVVGIAGVAWGGITYVKDRDTVELGPIKVNVEERDTIPIPPIAGAIALVAGVVLLMRRSGSSPGI